MMVDKTMDGKEDFILGGSIALGEGSMMSSTSTSVELSQYHLKEQQLNASQRFPVSSIDDVVSDAAGTISSIDEFDITRNEIQTNSKFEYLGKLFNKINFIDKGLFNVTNLGVSFFLMFCSYETTQNFLTTIREEEGFVALAILYAMFAFASFLSPSFCKVVGVKGSLLIASTGYVLFVFSAALNSAALLYLASGYGGFCAGLLWTAQASMLTMSATYSQNVRRRKLEKQQESNEIELRDTKSQADKKSMLAEEGKTNEEGNSNSGSGGELLGFYSGIFFALFQANYIGGNLLAGILLNMGISNSLIFIILGIICILGCLTLFGLRPLDKKYLVSTNENNETENAPSELKGFEKLKEQAKEFLSLVKGTVLVLFSKKMIIFSFISIYSGYSQGFFYGTLPPIIGKLMVGWVMILFGIVQVIAALLSGKLNDMVGKRISMVMGLIIHAIAIALSFQMIYWGHIYKPNGTEGVPFEVLLIHFVTMGLFAAGDAFLTNSIYSILGSKNYYKKKNTSEAFSGFRFIQANSSAVGFIIPTFTPIIAIQSLMVGTFLLCIVAFLVLDVFIASVDKDKKKGPKGSKKAAKDQDTSRDSIELVNNPNNTSIDTINASEASV